MTEFRQIPSGGDLRPERPLRGFFRLRGGYPNVADSAMWFALFLVANVVATLFAVAAGMPLPLPGSDEVPPLRSASLAAVYCIAMALTLGGVSAWRRMRGGERPQLRQSLRGFRLPVLLWGAALMFALGVVLEPLLALLPGREMPLGRNGWTLFSVVAAAPVLEEWLCRGMILESLRMRWGRTVAWVGSSLFFALLHLDPLYVVNAFAMGAVLGFVRLRTGSLFAPMVLHALNNGSALWLEYSGRGDLRMAEWIGSPWVYAALYALCLAVLAVSWRRLGILHPEPGLPD